MLGEPSHLSLWLQEKTSRKLDYIAQSDALNHLVKLPIRKFTGWNADSVPLALVQWFIDVLWLLCHSRAEIIMQSFLFRHSMAFYCSAKSHFGEFFVWWPCGCTDTDWGHSVSDHFGLCPRYSWKQCSLTWRNLVGPKLISPQNPHHCHNLIYLSLDLESYLIGQKNKKQSKTETGKKSWKNPNKNQTVKSHQSNKRHLKESLTILGMGEQDGLCLEPIRMVYETDRPLGCGKGSSPFECHHQKGPLFSRHPPICRNYCDSALKNELNWSTVA